LRVAVDANILISGIVWPRWAYAILMHALQGDFTVVLSPLVLAEARRRINLTFPEYLDGFEDPLTALVYDPAPVPTLEEVAAHQALVRQRKDVPIALSIRDARVDHFVTYDRDFTDPGETTRQVQAAIPGIILPPPFLRDVMGWTSAELEAIRHRDWSDFEVGVGGVWS
jgi:predicted nucleic acid-binding protein